MTDLIVVAGEMSGDLQGAKLLEKLLALRPNLKIGAVAGPRMRKLPIEELFPMENLQVMGFIDVLLALPQIIKRFFQIRNQILERNPKVVLCIDYPGFNLRLERSLRKKGYQGKLVHFVCPSVWAWGKKRIPLMEKHLDLLLTLFPFEKECFSATKLPVHYVGHPLASAIASYTLSFNFREKYRIREEEKILGIFPGSRKKEIERNFPLQLEAAKKLQALDPRVRIAVSLAHPNFQIEGDILKIPFEENYELMRACHASLATSGTVTLELALHGTPTVVQYAIGAFDCFLAQKIFKIRLPFYCIANIILMKPTFPELFGPNLTKEQLFSWIKQIWFEEEMRHSCLEGCNEIRKTLGINDAEQNSAEVLLSYIER